MAGKSALRVICGSGSRPALNTWATLTLAAARLALSSGLFSTARRAISSGSKPSRASITMVFSGCSRS